MNQWRQIPRALIVDSLIMRWTKEHPAPDLVGFAVAAEMLLAGSPWSSRKLSEHCGWTRYRANQVLHDVKVFVDQWKQYDRPLITNSEQPPKPSDSKELEEQIGKVSAGSRSGFSHHARGSTVTTTTTATPKKTGSSIRVDLDQLWENMESIRCSVQPNSKRRKLGGRRDSLRTRVGEHGEDAVLHAWRWWWESNDKAARFLRDGGYKVSTFLRPKNLRDYVDASQDWDPDASDGATGWFTDDDFDELGNLIQIKN